MSYRQSEQRRRVLRIWELAQQASGESTHQIAKDLRDRFGSYPEISGRSASTIRNDLMTYQRWVREGLAGQ